MVYTEVLYMMYTEVAVKWKQAMLERFDEDGFGEEAGRRGRSVWRLSYPF